MENKIEEKKLVKTKEVAFEHHKFDKAVKEELGINNISYYISNWKSFTWEDFNNILLDKGIHLKGSEEERWKEFFEIQKRNSAMPRDPQTDKRPMDEKGIKDSIEP
jgi:hypothetical protein